MPNVGDLCHILGRLDTCRIVGRETVPGDHDQPSELWIVETPDGTSEVLSAEITASWTVTEQHDGRYVPPPPRIGGVWIDGVEET